jgi:hypothetical protein
VGTKTPAAMNTTAANDKRNFPRISSTTPLPPLNDFLMPRPQRQAES